MNEACRHWHAVYSAAAIAVGLFIVAPMGITAFAPTETQIWLVMANLGWNHPQYSPEIRISYLISCFTWSSSARCWGLRPLKR